MESNNNDSNNVVYTGVVIFFDSKRGYGFIGYEIDGVKQRDSFVHYSDLNVQGFKTLYKDQKVSFSIGKNRNGDPKAINVTVIP